MTYVSTSSSCDLYQSQERTIAIKEAFEGEEVDVLVVDDEAISRRAVEYMLREAGYRVTTARDGEEALSLLKKNSHQIVLADWQMPRMDGLEFCRAIRAADLHHYVYFVLVTSRDRMGDKITGFETGIDDYIAKPFLPRELIMRVKVGRRIVEQGKNQPATFLLPELAESKTSKAGAFLDVVI